MSTIFGQHAYYSSASSLIMQRVGIVSCKMGYGAASTIGSPELEFYLGVAKTVLNSEVSPVQTVPIAPLVVDNATVNDNPGAVLSLMHEAFGKLAPTAEVIIVDLDIPQIADIRGAAHVNVYAAIKFAMDSVQRSNKQAKLAMLILVVPELPSSEGSSARYLREELATGKVLIISDDGHIMPEAPARPAFNKEQFCLKLSEIRGKPIDLLRRKLIHQRGHFKRDINGHSHCVAFYFDGRLCSKEIGLLVSQHIAERYMENRKPHILYHPTFSNWIEGPLQLLAGQLGVQCHSLQEVLADPAVCADFEVAPPLLVVQLIDSGNSLQFALREFAAKFCSQKINCLAILSTAGDVAQMGVRTIGNVEVAYIQRVHQAKYPRQQGKCPMCELRLPFSREGLEDNLMLTAYDFWCMIDQSGLKPESDPPTYRNRLDFVPDFPKMLDTNGAWLANKIGLLLSHTTGQKPNDIVVICPDEDGSQVLTEYLRMVCGVRVIRVAKTDLQAVHDAEDLSTLVNGWETSGTEWYMQMQSAAASDVVILDEFSLSAGKRGIMHKLLLHMGKTVVCYFSLADFCPHLDANSVIPALSLYEWRIHTDLA